MSGIVVFLPNETMCRQAEAILNKRKNHVIVNKLTTIDSVVEETRKAIELRTNIVVARGHQTSDVKLYTSVPMVEMVVTAQELELLIVKAKKMVNKPFPRIGIFCWEGMFYDTTYFKQLYEVRITTYHLESQDDWYELVEHGIAEGVDVLIGGEKCVRYVTQKDFLLVFLSTAGESIEVAINQAGTMYEMAEFEKHNYAQFSIVLDNSLNGIVKIGADGQVQTMNRVTEEMPRISVKPAAGQRILEIVPFMGGEKTEKVLVGEEETYSAFISNEKNAMVVITEPTVVEQVITDAIISCNRTMRLDWSKGGMKEKLLAGFVAHENLNHMLLRRPGSEDVVTLVRIYTQSNSPILVEGYSYEELEQFCQGTHNYSLRKNDPFVVMNAGNIPVERRIHVLFGVSEAGLDKEQRSVLLKVNDETLVMRVMDKLELSAQRHLLSAICKKRFGLLNIENENVQWVDTRIIACISKDPREMINERRFCKDLYYLLKAPGITLPKTSERRMDLEALLNKYYKKYLERHTGYRALTPEVRGKALSSQWGNNDVQLESFCERMIFTATREEISGEYVQSLLDSLYDLSEQEVRIPQTSSDGGFLRKAKIKGIRDVLMRYNGNRMLTAKHLSISTSTLWRYIKKYGI